MGETGLCVMVYKRGVIPVCRFTQGEASAAPWKRLHGVAGGWVRLDRSGAWPKRAETGSRDGRRGGGSWVYQISRRRPGEGDT